MRRSWNSDTHIIVQAGLDYSDFSAGHRRTQEYATEIINRPHTVLGDTLGHARIQASLTEFGIEVATDDN
jgi:hypothetical protein